MEVLRINDSEKNQYVYQKHLFREQFLDCLSKTIKESHRTKVHYTFLLYLLDNILTHGFFIGSSLVFSVLVLSGRSYC